MIAGLRPLCGAQGHLAWRRGNQDQRSLGWTLSAAGLGSERFAGPDRLLLPNVYADSVAETYRSEPQDESTQAAVQRTYVCMNMFAVDGLSFDAVINAADSHAQCRVVTELHRMLQGLDADYRHAAHSGPSLPKRVHESWPISW